MTQTAAPLWTLRAAVRAVLDDTSLTTPGDIAAKVAENTPGDALHAAYLEALTAFVRVAMSTDRRHPGPVPGARPEQRSRKTEAIREMWRRQLRARVHIGQGQWALLGECSLTHVRYLAEERREMAERNNARAARYEALAAAMATHGVDRVAELPEPVLAELLAEPIGDTA